LEDIVAKAKEWAERLKSAGEDINAVLADFALETRELVDRRSKNSDEKSKSYAIEGATREQRQKWEAVCRLIPTNISFEKLMTEHLNDVVESQTHWKNKVLEEKTKKSNNENKQEKVIGRSLITGRPVTEKEYLTNKNADIVKLEPSGSGI
jgi:hypothetical protein